MVTGLNTGLCVTELLSLNVGQVWNRGALRPRVTVTRGHLEVQFLGGSASRAKETVRLNHSGSP